MHPSLFAAVLLTVPAIAFPMTRPKTLADCAGIADNRQRLACFDRLAAEESRPPVQPAAPDASFSENPPATSAPAAKSPAFSLSRHWELDPEDKHGTFAFRPHYDNYVLFANYSTAPNRTPFSSLTGLSSEDTRLSHTELKFQLGFKMKLLENLSARHADLWFGYTQQSYWQAYNSKASSPFRETNYQPELMYVMPVDYHFLGMHGRFVNFGLVHQSNGRGAELSRSWNRLYIQTGLERGNFTLLARAWKRLNESAEDDDNPDILDYMGYGDLSATYRWRGHEFSVLARRNFRTDRGALQLGWAFPLAERIKGYVQLFSGYGQSLIDYNYDQKTLGLGILVSY